MAEQSIKLGVFTVSLPDYDPVKALEVLAELGYDGVEWRIVKDAGDRSHPSFWSGNRTSMSPVEVIANAKMLKRKAREFGLRMPSLGTYLDCSDLDAVDLNMRAAVAIGARNLRIASGVYDGNKMKHADMMRKARRAYAKVAKLAAQHKVRALIETHMGLVAPSVFATMQILQGLDPKDVGIMWDPANQIAEGGETVAMALDIAGDYLAEVHAKNMKFVQQDTVRGQQVWSLANCPVHEGLVNWPDVVDHLHKINYKGWVMLEDFSTAKPAKERLRQNLRYFRALLGK